MIFLNTNPLSVQVEEWRLQHIGFSLTLNDGGKIDYNELTPKIYKTEQHLTIIYNILYSLTNGIVDTIFLKWSKGIPNVIFISRELQNNSSHQIGISEIGFYFIEKRGTPMGTVEQVSFFHPQNLNFFQNCAPAKYESVLGHQFLLPVTGKHLLGNSENVPLPAIVILNETQRCGLFVGNLTENSFFQEFELKRLSNITGFRFSAFQRLRSGEKILDPGEKGLSEITYLEFLKSASLKKSFSGYVSHLGKMKENKFTKTPLRNELIWGTWNMKIGRKITEEFVLDNASYIRNHFPRVKWIQIDDGYMKTFGGDTGWPSLDENVDRVKFPHGMAYVAEEIQKLELKPAIWLGLMSSRKSKLFKKHPDWFLHTTTGEVYTPYKPSYCYLDHSHPEVQAYIISMLITIFNQWRYMGLKIDFYSYPFYAQGVRYYCTKLTPIELRNQFFGDIQKCIPKGGYCQICSAGTAMNILLGTYADNIRYTADIDVIEYNYPSLLNIIDKSLLATALGSDSLVLFNNDAIGYFPYLPEREEKTWALWCYITGTMLELGGDLPHANQKRLRDLKPLLNNPINGSSCELLSESYFYDEKFPVILYNKTYNILGIFNWDKNENFAGEIDISILPITGKVQEIREFWTGKRVLPEKKHIRYNLSPFGSRVWRIIVQ